MSEGKSYNQIFKATGIFGGVQLILILFGILRMKIGSIYLGPEGIGLIGIFTTCVTLIYSITSLGVGNSSIKFIAEANVLKDKISLNNLVDSLRGFGLISGVIGLLLTLIFSRILQKHLLLDFTFQINPFYILSAVILFFTIENNESAILQGTRSITFFAKAKIFGAAVGMIFTLSFYYYFGVKGIVPSLFISYLFNAFSHSYYSSKVVRYKISIRKGFSNNLSIINLGIAMSISLILVNGVSFFIRAYILNESDISTVGLYQAGFTLLNGYVGVIFVAMAKDYYPRLAEEHGDNTKLQLISNQQIEIALLLLAPIIIFLIVFMPTVINLLYTPDFEKIRFFINWALLGVYFKILSWSLSYIVLAKGDIKSFLTYEIAGNIINLVLNVICFKYYGLNGLGYAYFIFNVIYYMLVHILLYNKSSIRLDQRIFGILLITITATLSLVILDESEYSNILIKISILLGVIVYSIKKINEKIGIIKFIAKVIIKKK